jgi:hypothetical protein
MHNLAKRYLNAFDRVVEFGVNHPLTTADYSSHDAVHERGQCRPQRIRSHKGDQESGRGEFLGGSSNRVLKAEALRELMRPVNKIARALNREQVSRSAREVSTCRSLAPMKRSLAVQKRSSTRSSRSRRRFTDRGLPATFDAELTAAKYALVEATAGQERGPGDAGRRHRGIDGAGALWARADAPSSMRS